MESLASRALILSLHRIMPSKTEDERVLEKAYRSLSRLLTRCPERVNAQSLYVRDLMAVAKRKYGSGPTRPANLSQAIVKGAGRSFDQCSDAVKRRYEQETRTQAAQKRTRTEQYINYHRATIDMVEARAEERQGEGRPSIGWNDCAWGQRDMELYEAWSGNSEYQGLQLKERRQAALTPPQPMSPAELLAFWASM